MTAEVLGRRVIGVGGDFPQLAGGLLHGLVFEAATVERLGEISSTDVDLVLINSDGLDRPTLLNVIEALAALATPPAVLLIGANLPVGAVRAIMRLGRSDVMETPIDPDALVSAICALLTATSQATTTNNAASRCWSIIGAVGGAGATTLAVEAATLLANRSTRGRSVCLVDLHLADGAAAAYLGATPLMQLREFDVMPERIDRGLLAAFASPISEKLDVLACPRDALAFAQTPRQTVLRVLELACEVYEHVIVDLPRHRHAWTAEVLAGSDEVVVVSELTVPALLAARALSDEIASARPAQLRPRIVLNRLGTRMFSSAPSMGEAERALQRKVDAGVSSDWEAAAASVNLGGSISRHRPKSRIVRDVGALVDRMLMDGARAASTAERAA
ncbi:MAG: hypothetical protein Q8R82_22920 [Hyphomonadaceae bacterium]|nr:hypothetical protein [Hyphomonadaceae bacterium]